MALIAIVDDDADFTSLVAELLQDQGWNIVTCADEDAALACVEENDPDLIILDVRMQTRESGWHLLEAFQAAPATRALPVIVCSAATDDMRARSTWMQERGIAELHKPFDIDDLFTLVRDLLARGGSNNHSDQRHPDPSTPR